MRGSRDLLFACLAWTAVAILAWPIAGASAAPANGNLPISGPLTAAEQFGLVNDELAEIYKRAPFRLKNIAGTVDAITADGDPFAVSAIGGLQDGLLIALDPTGANTVTDPNLSIDGGAAVTITDEAGNALTVGELQARPFVLRYHSSGPEWRIFSVSLGGAGGGEINTASNVGVGGVGSFKQKTGVNLEFRNTNNIANETTTTLDAANNEIDVGLADNPIIPGTGSILLPDGTTGQRPGSPVNGMVRYNTSTNKFEGYENGTWQDLIVAGAGEANTASNIGTAGVGVFDQKVSVDLQFRNINNTANETSVTDDAGNNEIDIGLADNPTIPGTGHILVPAGTTAQRPGTPSNGMVRYNTTTAKFEGYENGAWANLVGAGGGSGKVLQIQFASKTDTETFSSADTWTDVTGMSVSITPANVANEVVVQGHITLGHNTQNRAMGYRVLRGATVIGVGATAGSRTSVMGAEEIGNTGDTTSVPIHVVDSPNTTSATTYKVQVISETQPFYVNRSGADTDNAQHYRGSSTLTLMGIRRDLEARLVVRLFRAWG